MANEEQLEILSQGVDVWNEWRNKNYEVDIDFRKADLSNARLRGIDFSEADLREIDLRETDLTDANFKDANLSRANLAGAYLKRADLRRVDFSNADLSGAILLETDLSRASFVDAVLRGTNILETILVGTSLKRAILDGVGFRGSSFNEVQLDGTFFGNLDLSKVEGLEKVQHLGPSNVTTDVFALSKGKIPLAFLQGCGLSDWEIEQVNLYNPDLSNDEFIDIQNKIFDLRQRQAVQISSLFISYSHANGIFVDKLEIYLYKKGIRFWRDVHDGTAGRLEKQIDRAIRHNPTVLLILSENSIMSDWVEHEVRTARELEKELGRDTLCPVALDDSWKSSPWPKRVMEQVMEYNILDFSEWEDDVKFEGMFRRLIDGLELFYKR